MRKFWHSLFLIPWLLWGNDEESLFLRRIAAFWEEGEYQLAKTQIEEFLDAFPESSFADALSAAIGDLFLKEGNYSSALTYYAQIKDLTVRESSSLSRMQCLYYLEWYATLADECEALLEKGELNEQKRFQTTYYLAIALYRQCLNAEKNKITLEKLAQRAKPYFEILLKSKLDTEVAQAFAHLSCILKEYPKASDIYLDLATKGEGFNEEMAFQAALIQSEYDKELAIQTFRKIVEHKGNQVKEALYNEIVLLFELGKFSELLQNKEERIQQVPENKVAFAQIFFGKAHLALDQFAEACAELKKALSEGMPLLAKESALAVLMDAAYQAADVSALDWGLETLTVLNPKSAEIPKGLLSKALLLKKNAEIATAKQLLRKILNDFPEFAGNVQTLFELLHLSFQEKDWESCREQCHLFLQSYPENELNLFAARYWIFATTQLALNAPDNALKEDLIREIPKLVASIPLLSLSEKKDWEFLIAKTKFELGHLSNAMGMLKALLSFNEPFSQEANALLLLALCHKDNNPTEFCRLAETALEKGCDLIGAETLHALLFNAYLKLSQEEPPLPERTDLLAPDFFKEQAANHLWFAFEKMANIQTENLRWLADFYSSRPAFYERAISILSRSLARFDLTPAGKIAAEPYLFKLSKLYAQMGKIPESLALAEKLLMQYQSEPHLDWMWQKEAYLLQGENLIYLGNKEKALQLLDAIVQETATLRTPTGASASLLSARTRKTLGQADKALTQLKDLTIQKTLMNEPTHLEAALDYLDLVMQDRNKSLPQRIFLLRKTKEDFESSSDLLSKDYHAARIQHPEKDKMFQAYMHYLEAEILLAESALSQSSEIRNTMLAKAHHLLLQIIDESSCSPLVGRVEQRLQSAKKEYGAFSEEKI